MNNKKNGIPKLRFPGFTGAWEQRKLNEFLKTSKLKNENNKFTKKDVLSVSGDYGIVNQIKFKGRSFAGSSVQKYRIVNTNDVVYTKSPLKNNPYGIIKANKGKPGIVSTLYAVYKTNEKVNASFVEYYFENDYRLNTYLKPLVNKGAKNDMKVSDDNALIGNVIFPLEYSEQIKIVKFLNRFDTLITLHQRKLEHLQEQKKGLLQKMFPKNGETVPEVRFPGFTDAWEQRKLGEITSVITKGTTPLDKSGKGSINFVKVEDLSPDNSGINVHSMISKEEHEGRLKRSILKENDILFSIAGTLGRIGIVKSEILPANTNQALAIVRLKEGNLSYISTVLEGRTVREYIRQNPTVGAQPNLSLKQVSELRISFPTLQEQEQVGNFFNKLNSFIALHQRKLDHLELMKKGLLQQMFV